MSQSSEDSSRVGPEFDLPYEILSVIPKDPYDQLDLARKITSMAIASRVTMLESETGRLRQKLHEKDRVIVELQDKVSQVEQAYEEAELQLKSTREDNMKLLKERDSLALTTKKLSRDLAKFKFELVSREHQFQDYNLCIKNSSRLETFKRQLMQSLNDENSPQAETVDIGTYDHTVSKAYTKNDEDTNGYVICHSYSGSTDTASITDNASKQAGRRYSITPYITPGLTPIGTPKVISNSASPGRYSAAGSPQKTSGTTSPRTQYGRRSLSSWYPSSQQSSATNSPPRGLPVPARPPRIDGKEFFRQARSRLSLEQFSAFLANIKELNAQKKSREETLRKAEEIFGMENKDLYLSFQGLLNRNIH